MPVREAYWRVRALHVCRIAALPQCRQRQSADVVPTALADAVIGGQYGRRAVAQMAHLGRDRGGRGIQGAGEGAQCRNPLAALAWGQIESHSMVGDDIFEGEARRFSRRRGEKNVSWNSMHREPHGN
jgi:hypothetical protein